MTITAKQWDRVNKINSFSYTNQTATELAWLNKQVKFIIEAKGKLKWAHRHDCSDAHAYTCAIIQGLTELSDI